METLKIDLRKYTNVARKYYSGASYPEYGLRERGLEAAKDHALSKKAGEVDKIILETVPGIPVRETFLKALLGPAARKIGPQALMDKLEVSGSGEGDPDFTWSVEIYLENEVKRITKRVEKKKAEKDTVWMSPQNFFVPEIGTKLILMEDWEFRLFVESRNVKLFQQFGYDYYPNNESPYDHHKKGYKVTLLKDSILTVDRIYVRKGVKDYSSITFNLRKGSQAKHNGGLYPIRGARFWAKLADVNRIYASVDRNSVPGLECDDDPETAKPED